MATTTYFEECIRDQNGEDTLTVEFGRSSFYSGCKLDNGKNGEDSIFLRVEQRSVIMDRATAQKFVEAALLVGRYHGLLD